MRVFPSNRIVTDIYQPKPMSHPLSIIEVKKDSSRSPTCSYPFNEPTIEAKMPVPSLLTRIEEKDNFV